MDTLIGKRNRGNSFLRGFTSRDPINATTWEGQEGMEAFLSESDQQYTLEIPRSVVKNKEVELGLGDDHLTLFMADASKDGHEYHSVIFGQRVKPDKVTTAWKPEVFRVTIPKEEAMS